MKKLLFALMLFGAVAAAQETKERKTCSAKTKAGEPCKGTILMKDGKCRSHSNLTFRCSGETKSGERCKIPVSKAGDFCKHHELKH